MVFSQSSGRFFGEAMKQNIRKELMIAIPMPFIVKRRQEEIVAFQFFQDCLAVCAPRERIAKRGVQTLEIEQLVETKELASGRLKTGAFSLLCKTAQPRFIRGLQTRHREWTLLFVELAFDCTHGAGFVHTFCSL